MAANMLKVNTRGGSLRHLVLGGSFYPAPNADLMHSRDFKDLCAALQDMPRLRTLKLRSLGITEIDRLVATLRNTRPPLEVLDLSYNMLANASALLELSNIPKVNKELRAIVLSHNMIDTKQGRELFSTFSDFPIDLTLDNNKVDFAALVRTYQDDLRNVERDRDDWRAQAENGSHAPGGVSPEVLSEIAALKAENKRLRDERDVMMRAFTLTGVSRQAEEQRKLLDRVQRLEVRDSLALFVCGDCWVFGVGVNVVAIRSELCCAVRKGTACLFNSSIRLCLPCFVLGYGDIGCRFQTRGRAQW